MTETQTPSADKISPALLQELEQSPSGSADIFIILNSDNSYPLSKVNATVFATREERLNAVSSALRDHAAREQKAVLEFLKSQGPNLEIESMWINNQIFVKGVGRQLVEALAMREDVKEIKENGKIVLDDPVNLVVENTASVTATTTNTKTNDG